MNQKKSLKFKHITKKNNYYLKKIFFFKKERVLI
jgi:hypothetical protein